MQNVRTICENPLFGVLLTLAVYELMVYIYKKSGKFVLLNPLLTSIISIMLVLFAFDIPYEAYNVGGQFITMLVPPLTVVLAIPLYMQIKVLQKNAAVILIAITLGCIAAVTSVCVFQIFYPMDPVVFASIIPKSVTTAIAVELSAQFGGNPAITVIAVLIAGLFGAVFAPVLSKLFKIKNDISLGLAIGTSSHALGTSKALELGERVGAMSGLSIGVAGIVTTLVAPLIMKLFGLI